MTKQEQLQTAFKTILNSLLRGTGYNAADIKYLVKQTTNELLKEVSIRTPLK